jgi:hypothetical protein
MHPVLAAALANPRMPRPYGADRADNLFGRAFGDDYGMATDRIIRQTTVRVFGFENEPASEAEHLAAGYVKPETLH